MKKFAKFLCLAQAASDSGKDAKNKAHNSINAIDKGYGLKDLYIRQAIAEAKRLKHVKVSRDIDHCMFGMTVVYFDIEGYGQVSFHSFSSFKNLKWSVNGWNGIKGGSPRVCRKLNKKFNLQVYK